jgi:fructose-bisphosphate aldolase class I
MQHAEMTQIMAKGDGFIAALDQSGGSTPKALKGYGIEESAWSSDDEMFGLIHEMRQRIITSPSFASGKVIGAILFEKTMDGMANGTPVPQLLLEKGVVPFIKIDKGLEDREDGVQLMKPMPELDALLERARGLGVYGTKERSVIHHSDPDGIEAIARQQFDIGKKVLAHGMMPILEPEINITSETRGECDVMLRDAILEELSKLPDSVQVMLKLSIPEVPGTHDVLVDHPNVLRVVALSGGFSRDEACEELAKNKGMIASFSRALLNDLRAGMSDAEFDAALGQAIDDIYAASVA